jgi:hypothetical protein
LFEIKDHTFTNGFLPGSHGLPKVFGRSEPVLSSQQKLLRRQFGATLAATSCKDGATRTGLHAQTETVGLRTTTVVWLESTLRHGDLLLLVEQSMCFGNTSRFASAVPYAEQPVKSTPNYRTGSSYLGPFRKKL